MRVKDRVMRRRPLHSVEPLVIGIPNRIIMEQLLNIIFTANFILLMLHEMDAVFWKEWRKFGIKNDDIGRNVFVLAHIPIYLFLLTGLFYSDFIYGRIVSILLSVFLIFHFGLHLKFYSQNYFKENISFGIISAMLVISVFQGAITLIIMLK
jgi:hypothetical protein